jgi:hypothetical protein
MSKNMSKTMLNNMSTSLHDTYAASYVKKTVKEI